MGFTIFYITVDGLWKDRFLDYIFKGFVHHKWNSPFTSILKNNFLAFILDDVKEGSCNKLINNQLISYVLCEMMPIQLSKLISNFITCIHAVHYYIREWSFKVNKYKFRK